MSTISASTTSTTAYKVTADTTGTLVFQTGASPTTAMSIDGSQNVGVGATPSTWTVFKAFEVGAAGTGLAGAAGQPVLFANCYYNSGWKYAATGVASQYDQSSGAHRWFNITSGTAGGSISWNQAMTLNASSNLQLGTTTVSAARLNVFSSDVNKQIVFSNNETYYGSVAHNAATGMNEYRTEATGGHAFFKGTDSTAGMTFDSSGDLLVGMTSSSGASSSTKQVCSYYGMSINKNFTDQGGRRNWAVDTEVSSAGDFVIFSSTTNTGAPNTVRLQVTNAGSCYNSTGTYGTFSDIKLKENVVDATPKLDRLMQVRVVNYNRIGEDHKELGVIAQELEQIFPGMVDTTEDLVDGQPAGTTTKAVKYSIFVPMLIKAMQEQQAIIETLTNRITALEAK